MQLRIMVLIPCRRNNTEGLKRRLPIPSSTIPFHAHVIHRQSLVSTFEDQQNHV